MTNSNIDQDHTLNACTPRATLMKTSSNVVSARPQAKTVNLLFAFSTALNTSAILISCFGSSHFWVPDMWYIFVCIWGEMSHHALYILLMIRRPCHCEHIRASISSFKLSKHHWHSQCCWIACISYTNQTNIDQKKHMKCS